MRVPLNGLSYKIANRVRTRLLIITDLELQKSQTLIYLPSVKRSEFKDCLYITPTCTIYKSSPIITQQTQHIETDSKETNSNSNHFFGNTPNKKKSQFSSLYIVNLDDSHRLICSSSYKVSNGDSVIIDYFQAPKPLQHKINPIFMRHMHEESLSEFIKEIASRKIGIGRRKLEVGQYKLEISIKKKPFSKGSRTRLLLDSLVSNLLNQKKTRNKAWIGKRKPIISNNLLEFQSTKKCFSNFVSPKIKDWNSISSNSKEYSNEKSEKIAPYSKKRAVSIFKPDSLWLGFGLKSQMMKDEINFNKDWRLKGLYIKEDGKGSNLLNLSENSIIKHIDSSSSDALELEEISSNFTNCCNNALFKHPCTGQKSWKINKPGLDINSDKI